MTDCSSTRIALLRDQAIAAFNDIGDAIPAVLRDAALRLEQIAQDLRQQAALIEAADSPALDATAPIAIWTDGACSGNPGPGGWAVVLTDGQKIREIVGGAESTTNNAMELAAILAALEAVPAGARVRLHTDSQNAIGWLAQGWKRKDPKVAALCAQIDQTVLSKGLQVAYAKAIAHQDDAMNNRADALAAAEAQRRRGLAAA
jgi:ribonuclease HI